MMAMAAVDEMRLDNEEDSRDSRRDSGVQLRTALLPGELSPALQAAQVVIARLEQEIARLGDALESQHELYERTLADERQERRLVMQARGERARRQSDENARLREQNARLVAERDAAKWSQRRSAASLKLLRAEHERVGQAYRASLKALRQSFEKQLDVA